MSQPAVFLDRDNTLIINDGDLGAPEEVRLLDGVAPGLRALRQAGYRLVVVTNQGGVARGAFTEDDVDAVHQRIARLVDETAEARDLIDRFYYCPYHPEGVLDDYRRDHPWRKPNPGMLLQAARDMNLDLARCWMIGDQSRDIAAGQSAGCRTVLIGDRTSTNGDPRPTVQTTTFGEAVDVIVHDRVPPKPKKRPSPTTAPETSTTSAPTTSASDRDTDAPAMGDLRRAIGELTEELRTERLRRAEFTATRLAAGLTQLFALLLAVLGLLQLQSTDVFMKWMIGAAVVQLVTITILLLDSRG